MIRNVLTYPQNADILCQKSVEIAEINEEVKNLIQDLKDTLHEDRSGVGISAIQIGVPKRVCYIEYGGESIVMINPVITWTRSGISGMKEFKEGCLSAPGTFTIVKRPQKVKCEYTNELGEKKEISEGGWMSAIIQHELEHFEGYCAVFDAVEGE